MKTQKELKRNTRKGVKVVYISSPMKVKTSASEFRALVQELTGINSDAERYMEINGVGDSSDYYHRQCLRHADDHQDRRLTMKSTRVEDNHEREEQFPYFSMINTSSFCDFPVSSSEYSSLFQLQTVGNDQSIFS